MYNDPTRPQTVVELRIKSKNMYTHDSVTQVSSSPLPAK